MKHRIWLLLHGLKYLVLIWVGRVPAHWARRRLYAALGMKPGARTSIDKGAEGRARPASTSVTTASSATGPPSTGATAYAWGTT